MAASLNDVLVAERSGVVGKITVSDIASVVKKPSGIFTGDFTPNLDGETVLLDSRASGFTITLPSSPSVKDSFRFKDVGRNSATNPIALIGNGNNINGLDEVLNININGIAGELTYVDTSLGWSFTL